jgi:hypothetical protein
LYYGATLLKKSMSAQNMKKNTLIIILLFAAAACNKEKNPVVTGTVQQPGGCLANTWLVFIDNGNAAQYSFLCESPTSTSSFNCSNSVYILDMPASFRQLGKRVKFSRWKDNGLSCLSSSFAPHHLEVSDLSAE